jgi:hypothetical protein
MKRRIPLLIGVALSVAFMAPAFAAGTSGPTPNCFGAGRSAYAQANGSLGHDVGGVGYYASLRAGDNGTINHQYMENVCGGPTQPPG